MKKIGHNVLKPYSKFVLLKSVLRKKLKKRSDISKHLNAFGVFYFTILLLLIALTSALTEEFIISVWIPAPQAELPSESVIST